MLTFRTCLILKAILTFKSILPSIYPTEDALIHKEKDISVNSCQLSVTQNKNQHNGIYVTNLQIQ